MYRRLLVALMVVAMLAMVAAPAFAEPPSPNSDMATGEATTEGLPPATGQIKGPDSEATIYLYSWLNLMRGGSNWTLRGKTHVISLAYDATSAPINLMIVKNRLCRPGRCTVWTTGRVRNRVWVRAGWSVRYGRSPWLTYGIHIFKHGRVKKRYRTRAGAPL